MNKLAQKILRQFVDELKGQPHFSYYAVAKEHYCSLRFTTSFVFDEIVTIQLELVTNEMPRVYWLTPKLKNEPKHIYGYNERLKGYELCLMHWSQWKLTEENLRYILPWTAEWFYYNFQYSITGKWLGEEWPHDEPITHQPKSNSRNDSIKKIHR